MSLVKLSTAQYHELLERHIPMVNPNRAQNLAAPDKILMGAMMSEDGVLGASLCSKPATPGI